MQDKGGVFMTMEKFGTFLARLRRQSGLTQQQLAEHLGVSNKSVSRWETGQSAPDVFLLPTLAALLGVTVDALLAATPDPLPPPEGMGPAARVNDAADIAPSPTVNGIAGVAPSPAAGPESACPGQSLLPALAQLSLMKSLRLTILCLGALAAGLTAGLICAWGLRLPQVGVGLFLIIALLTCSGAIAGACKYSAGPLPPEVVARVVSRGTLVCCMGLLAVCAMLPQLLPTLSGQPDVVITLTGWLTFLPVCLSAGILFCLPALALFYRRRNRARSRRMAAAFGAALALCPAFWLVQLARGGNGQCYDSFESFRASIEQPAGDVESHTVTFGSPTGSYTKTLYGSAERYIASDGTVYRYRYADHTVARVVFSEKSGRLTVTTYTDAQLARRHNPPLLLLGLPLAVAACAVWALLPAGRRTPGRVKRPRPSLQSGTGAL